MKTIKKIPLLFLLFFTSFTFAQIIDIPDANFKAILVSEMCADTTGDGNLDSDVDLNNNGEIEVSEAEAVLYLDIEFLNNLASSLEGIQYFTNLERLNCAYNSITALDLSSNIQLTILSCGSNQLTSLDISQNTLLTSLFCSDNQLTDLDLSSNTQLTALHCNENLLTDLDISQNTLLTILNCGENQLTDLDLSQNTQLTTLTCNSNQLTSLDLSQNTQLTYFSCGDNLMTGIDISQNLNLETFSCSGMDLSMLDVSNNINLTTLYLYNNGLTSLDVTQNVNLEDLSCASNQLTELDVTQNVNLTSLECSSNQLTELDVSSNTSIEYLVCSDNQLADLDVSANTSLDFLHCDSNNITTLDLSTNGSLMNVICTNNDNLITLFIKNGSSSTSYNFNNNPNLVFICADEFNFDTINEELTLNGMSGVVVNSYCSFTPSGGFNTITGNITFDSQNDGCGVNDIVNPFIKAYINDGVDTGYSFTTDNGEYTFYTNSGSFTVGPEIENAAFFNITPSNANVNFSDSNNNIEVQDFCITANGVHPDIEVVIAPSIPARPGFDAEYLITYKNKGNQTVSGDVIFNYDDTVLDYLSSNEAPTSQTTGTLSWDYSDLLPFESRSIYVTLNVNGPMETPAINIDDQLDFSATANSDIGDDFPSDNTFPYKQTVVGSYDPNDITCIQGDIVESAEIGNYLHYLIRFENTGNAPAENVVVETEVDPTQFDINSLRLLSSSHDVDVRIENNLIKFIFEAIYLEATGGHGHILLKMRTKQNLEINDTVTKAAQIFFDYNFPIETNDANTTFAVLSNPDYEVDSSINLYPNPVKNILTIRAKNSIKSVSIFDVKGRLLQTQIDSNTEIELDMSARSEGLYFVKIITDKGIKVEKIIKN